MLSSFQVSLYSSYVDGSTPQWCGDEGKDHHACMPWPNFLLTLLEEKRD